MNGAFRRIREICSTLDACAQSLDALRADHPVSGAAISDAGGDAPLWGGTVGARPSRVNGTSFWYDEIEPLYRELDELIRYAPGELCESVLCDEQIRTLAPGIHRIRAAYERDRELIQARKLVKADDAQARLKSTIDQESYWALGEELLGALNASRHILVAGSGPLPLTALCIGATLDVHVTCVERDAESHSLGQQLIGMSGVEERFESINADILDLTNFDDYDAIVGVVLLGVGTEDHQTSTKAAIAQHIITHMSPGTRMVLRDPHGLGNLLYPSVELGENTEVDVTRHVPDVGLNRPYRSGLVVAERRSPDTDHAH